MKHQRRAGFTLIELLVVIAIIGLLATLAVVALNSARRNARDGARLNNVKQLQTALELYYNDHSGYPIVNDVSGPPGDVPPPWKELGVDLQCLGTSGFGSLGCAGAYIAVVPRDPQPTIAQGGDAVFYYASDAGGTTYYIVFRLEGRSGDLGAGIHYMTPRGIADGMLGVPSF